MPTFTPPSFATAAMALDGVTSPYDIQFWAHFQSHIPVGINVFKLVDGAYTDSRYGTPDPSRVAVTYLGGHETPVTDAELALLAAAGYTSTTAPGVTPTPTPTPTPVTTYIFGEGVFGEGVFGGLV